MNDTAPAPVVVVPPFWTRPRYGTRVHAYAPEQWGPYSVRVGRGIARAERNGVHWHALCARWPHPVPGHYDHDHGYVVDVPLRHDRPPCNRCVEFVRGLSAQLSRLPAPRKSPPPPARRP